MRERGGFSGISLWLQFGGWEAGLPRADSTGPLGSHLLPGRLPFSLLDFSSMVRNSFLCFWRRDVSTVFPKPQKTFFLKHMLIGSCS